MKRFVKDNLKAVEGNLTNMVDDKGLMLLKYDHQGCGHKIQIGFHDKWIHMDQEMLHCQLICFVLV